MSNFSEICKTHKMRVSDMPVSHAAVVDKMPSAHSGGVCRGLTTVWLASYGTTREDPMEAGYDAALQDKDKLFIVRQIQQMESSRSDTFGMMLDKKASNAELGEMFDGVGFGNSLKSNLTALGCKGAAIQGIDRTGFASKDDFPFAGTAAYCSKHVGLHLIKFPSHYCGVIVDDDRFFYAFLDVNYGQAASSNAHSFKQFLVEYFASSTVRGYGKETTGVAHAVVSW